MRRIVSKAISILPVDYWQIAQMPLRVAESGGSYRTPIACSITPRLANWMLAAESGDRIALTANWCEFTVIHLPVEVWCPQPPLLLPSRREAESSMGVRQKCSCPTLLNKRVLAAAKSASTTTTICRRGNAGAPATSAFNKSGITGRRQYLPTIYAITSTYSRGVVW